MIAAVTGAALLSLAAWLYLLLLRGGAWKRRVASGRLEDGALGG